MVEVRKLTLAGMAEGAPEELFAAAVAKVLENVEDPNTDTRAKRTVTLKFEFSADEERRMGDIVVSCSTKLAGVKGLKVPVYYGRHEGERRVVEGPTQKSLFDKPDVKLRAIEPAGKV